MMCNLYNILEGFNLGTFNFRGDKYDSDKLEKLCTTGHTEVVEKDLIVISNTTGKNKPLVAMKVEGLYHVLQGSIETEQQKYKLICINKFVLKKCKIEEPVKAVTSNLTFQQRWNAENNKSNHR